MRHEDLQNECYGWKDIYKEFLIGITGLSLIQIFLTYLSVPYIGDKLQLTWGLIRFSPHKKHAPQLQHIFYHVENVKYNLITIHKDRKSFNLVEKSHYSVYPNSFMSLDSKYDIVSTSTSRNYVTSHNS